MNNGFYNLKHMTTEELRAFYKDAVLYGYDTHLEYIPKWTRENYKGSSIMEFIDTHCNTGSHNVCIDRAMYGHPAVMANGEVGFSIIHGDNTGPTFLYITMTIDNLNKLVEKYHLKLRDD